MFVSSTFADFVTERDVLRERVWPRLRAYCAAHGARFQEVDLRWGVSEEAALDQQTMNICLKEVERCHEVTPRPNFLILVGDRTGWMPPPPQIPAAEWDLIKPCLNQPDQEFVAEWYVLDYNAVPAEYRLLARTGEFVNPTVWATTEARLQTVLATAVTSLPLSGSRKQAYLCSATDQEIALGALGAHRPGQVVCFTRTISGHPRVANSDPKAAVRTFVDSDTIYLGQLKAALKERFGRSQVIEETVPWGVDAPDLGEAYLVRFADGVYAALQAAIDEELTNPWPRPAEPGIDDPHLDEEGRLHREFGAKKVEFFTGRTEELAAIRAYLHGTEPRPLIVHGEGGTGKSALMAAAAREALHDQSDAVIITRFIGATPTSSDGRALLASICAELARRCGEAESHVPNDYAELVTDFAARLGKATAQQPLIVMIDSLDQLDPGPARGLAWIPPQLADHTRLVLSTRRGDTLTPLLRRSDLLELLGLSTADGEELLKAWLDNAHRTLQPEQRAHVLDLFTQSAGNALYLQLASEEACRWTSADRKPPETLAAGVEPLIRQNLFGRLEHEDQHGKMLVAHALGYLAASRYGLAEDELVDLLSRDPDVYGWFLARAFHLPPDLLALDPDRKIAVLHEKPDVRKRMQADPSVQAELEAFLVEVLPRPDGPRLPAVVWSRLLADLDPYLTLRRADGGDLLAFHHRELNDVARDAYAASGPGRALHGRLADYFQVRWPKGEHHALSELPYHLTQGESWERLEQILTDLTFMAAKVQAGMAYGLLEDLQRPPSMQAATDIASSRHAVVQSMAALMSAPHLALQTLYNRLVWATSAEASPLGKNLAAALAILTTTPWLRATAPLPENRVADIHFQLPSSIQSLSSDGTALAVADERGEVHVYDVAGGVPIDSRQLEQTRIVSIAVCANPQRLAWMTTDGSIHTDQGDATLQGRSGDHAMLYHPEAGVIAVRSDDSLVAWNPESGNVEVLVRSLTAPLITLRFSIDGDQVTFATRGRASIIGYLSLAGTEWESRTIPYSGPPIRDVDLLNAHHDIVILSQDRRLSVTDISDGSTRKSVNYEMKSSSAVTGAPFRCAVGGGVDSRRVYFATHAGRVAAWNLETDAIQTFSEAFTETDPHVMSLFAYSPVLQTAIITTEQGVKHVAAQDQSGLTDAGHSSEVMGCFVTTSGKVVSAGKQDKMLHLTSLKGLNLLAERIQSGLTCISSCGDTDNALIGDRRGWIWEQPPDREVTVAEMTHIFEAAVEDAFWLEPGVAIAANKAGRILRVNIIDDLVEAIRPSGGPEQLIRLLPANDYGLCWSLRRELFGDNNCVLTLHKDSTSGEEVLRSGDPISNAAVSGDGNVLALALPSRVEILAQGPQGWQPGTPLQIGTRNIAILDRAGRLLTVSSAQVPNDRHGTADGPGDLDWLLICHSDNPHAGGWRVIASTELPGPVTCLAANGKAIAVGFASGQLATFTLENSEQMFETRAPAQRNPFVHQ